MTFDTFFHFSRYRMSTACTAETHAIHSKVWFNLCNFKTYFPLHCSGTNQFSSVQFIPSTDSVVRETQGTIQQISSSSIFCERPSRALPAVQSLTLPIQHFLCRCEYFRQSSRWHCLSSSSFAFTSTSGSPVFDTAYPAFPLPTRSLTVVQSLTLPI